MQISKLALAPQTLLNPNSLASRDSRGRQSIKPFRPGAIKEAVLSRFERIAALDNDSRYDMEWEPGEVFLYERKLKTGHFWRDLFSRPLTSATAVFRDGKNGEPEPVWMKLKEQWSNEEPRLYHFSSNSQGRRQFAAPLPGSENGEHLLLTESSSGVLFGEVLTVQQVDKLPLDF